MDQERLSALSTLLMDRIDEVFELFNIALDKDSKKYVGCCPVHGGDNNSSLNLYHDNSVFWKCRTHGCEKTFLGTPIGLIRGILSHRDYNWSAPGDQTIPFEQTIQFILNFLKQDYGQLEVDIGEVEKRRFTNLWGNKEKIVEKKGHITRNELRKGLVIPAEYYLRRGYSKYVLDKYDIGLCKDTMNPLCGRIVAPSYDNAHKYLVGGTGRIPHDKCSDCGVFHDPTHSCPMGDDKKKSVKWKHMPNFNSSNYLYNFWYAKEYIKESGVAIVVESPGNVWRLEEAEIHNGVALFGTCMSNSQRMILDASGAMSIILCMDNDENKAGQKATATIRKQCERIYRVFEVQLPTGINDIGEMDPSSVSSLITPYVERAKI